MRATHKKILVDGLKKYIIKKSIILAMADCQKMKVSRKKSLSEWLSLKAK